MAKVFWLVDHPKPVNAGEKRVLDHLIKTLPDSVVLIPNLTIPFPRPEEPSEYDIIAITPDAVFAIEVKDLAQSVEFTEQYMYVNGNPRGNPYIATRNKAQKLKSKISDGLPWFKNDGWVEHLVVLARKPASLSVCEGMKERVVELEHVSNLIAPGNTLIHPRFRGKLSGKHEQLVSRITDGASERIIPIVFGGFLASSSMFVTERLEAWRAKHILTGVEVVLEVHRLDPNMPRALYEQWKNQCLHIEEISRMIGSSADIDSPRQSFQLDNGTLVVVWPNREPITLANFLNQIRTEGSGLDVTSAKKLLSGFCSALAHLHAGGWVLGDIREHNLAVRPNGRGAIVLGEPVPTASADTTADLQWLSSIVNRVNELVKDDGLKELADNLQLKNTDLRITALIAMASLSGVNLQRPERSRNLLSRFTHTQVVSTHQYGQTLLAEDSQLKRSVIVKHETGRPEMSWAIREYRTLSLPSVANNQHVATASSGDTEGDDSYVAIEVIEAPTLASMIDIGVLQDPQMALTVTAQLLEALKSLHPNVPEILRLLASSNGMLDEDTQDKIGELRDSGIAHNHLDPSNIFVHRTRGVILTDLVRAARFGEIIPSRSVAYWPKDLPLTVSNPLADLFAVGSLLLRMLATSPDGVAASIGTTTELGKHLLEVALKAISDNPNERFASADEFLDSVLSSAAVGTIPTIAADAIALQQQIEELVNTLQFEDALAICPPEWKITRERIIEKQKLINTQGIEIWGSGNLMLRYIGQIQIPEGTTAAAQEHSGGIAELYHSTDGEGGVIELLVCKAETEDGIARWTSTGNGFGYPDRLSHAVRSLRISINEDDEKCHMELVQAQLKKNPDYPNQSTKKMVDKIQFSKPIVNGDAEKVFASFGSIGFDTKARLWGETNNRRNYLAVTFPTTATHIPALAHFISRIIPLYAGVTES
jgi:serine/threonine protein kinase